MQTIFRDVSWSANMKKAYRIACHSNARKKQDAAFRRNMKIKQSIVGTVISLLSIVIAWWFSEFYGLTEYFLMAGYVVLVGIWLIATPHNFMWEIKKEREEKEYGSSRMESQRVI